MIYAFMLLDRSDAADLRLRVRPEHKKYLAAIGDRIAFAGPLLGEDGSSMVGSLLAIEFAARDDALQWLSGEPFTKAGLYQSVSVYPFVNLWQQKVGFPPP